MSDRRVAVTAVDVSLLQAQHGVALVNLFSLRLDGGEVVETHGLVEVDDLKGLVFDLQVLSWIEGED